MTPTINVSIFAWAALALIVLPLFGCTPGGDLPALPEQQAGPYTLGAGDKIKVITFGSEQLSGEFQIADTGKLAFPLLGSIPAAGVTTDQLQETLDQALRQKNILTDPKVAVEVVSYRPVFILGEVSRPGSYPYQPGMTVLSAVSTAGGFTYRAQEGFASITRTTGGAAAEGKVGRQSFVLPGDVVTIFERRF
jgi:polysaccharide export outer membrane protein